VGTPKITRGSATRDFFRCPTRENNFFRLSSYCTVIPHCFKKVTTHELCCWQRRNCLNAITLQPFVKPLLLVDFKTVISLLAQPIINFNYLISDVYIASV
jgi:hypothetical protein